jgi:hypothetical protein
MHITRTLLALFTFTVAALGALAQENVMGVLKAAEFTTTDGTTTTAASTPYNFNTFINLSGSAAGDTVGATVPSGSTGNVSMTFSGGDGWEYSQNFTGAPSTAKSNMDAAFANGDYTLNSNSSFVTLTLGSGGADLYTSAPLFTVTNGTFTPFWSGGVLRVDPTQTLTITSGTFSGFVANQSFIGLDVEGGSNNLNLRATTFSDMSLNTVSLNVSSGSILSGQTYSGILEFIRWTEVDTTTVSGVTAVAGFASITSFSIQAVPEPSTYAAIIGALALAGVMLARRRRAAA